MFDIAGLLFTPISGSVWWFVTAYVALMLVAPAYNQFLRKLNRRGISIWILALLVFGYTFGNIGSKLHDLEQALFFYTLGFYFRDYVKCSHGKERMIYFALSILGIVLNGVCQYGVCTFAGQNAANVVLHRKVLSMADHMIAEPLACFGIFGLFAGLPLQSRMINLIAGHTFGVYLFHEAPIFRQLIWISLLRPGKYYGQGFLFAYIAFCVLIVFVIGVLIDTIREKLFARWLDSFADVLTEWFIKTGYR